MNKSTLAMLSLLLICFIWGIDFVLTHDAILFIQPNTYNALRFAMAVISIFAWIFAFERPLLKQFNTGLFLKGGILGIFMFVGFSTQTMGMMYTSVSNTGFITSLCVIYVPLFSFFILKDRLKVNAAIGICIATVGLYLLTMSGGYKFNQGDLLVMVCAVFFALRVVFTSKFLKGYSPTLLALIQMITVMVLSTFTALFFEEWQLAFNPQFIGQKSVIYAILFGAILGTAVAYMVQTASQKHLSATRVGLIFTSEPVFTACSAYLLLGEQLGGIAIAGAGLIITGVLIVETPASLASHLLRLAKMKSRPVLPFRY